VSVSALSESVNVRMTPKDLLLLDQMRGPKTRATLLRELLHAEGARRKRAGRPSKPPTHAEALRMLRDHAEHDPAAAIELARTLGAEEKIARLKAITDGDDGAA
jgi:hypothetical protein